MREDASIVNGKDETHEDLLRRHPKSLNRDVGKLNPGLYKEKKKRGQFKSETRR